MRWLELFHVKRHSEPQASAMCAERVDAQRFT
jgi:hypothetical protein